MKLISVLSLSLSILASAIAAAETPTTILHAGQLLAVPGEAPLEKQSLVLRDGVIREIRDGHIGAKDLSSVEGEVVVMEELVEVLQV